MVTRQSKRGSFSAASQERVEQTAQQAGIADGLGEFVKLAPQVFELQQQLLAGITQSQRREAQRLAGLYADDDPRIARAVERAAQVEQLQAQAQAQAQVVGHAVQTFQQDGIFHGYVHQSDGAPAAAYTVELLMRIDKQARAATTNDAGYFRIDLPLGAQTNGQEEGAPARWTEHLARLAGLAAAGEAAPSKEATAAGGEVAAVSSVRVLDPNERVVFEDPDPPSFDPLRSEFRFYVLTP
jgi:hypothetical protein